MNKTIHPTIASIALIVGFVSGGFNILFALNGYTFASQTTIRWMAFCSAVSAIIVFASFGDQLAQSQEEIERLKRKYEPSTEQFISTDEISKWM